MIPVQTVLSLEQTRFSQLIQAGAVDGDYDSSMPVDHCVCFNTSFERMKEFAMQTGCGVDGLRERFGCGRGCALCIPYVRAMLETGKTEFPADLSTLSTTTGDNL